jgi:gamma-glutamyltranspeptidase/glutathione hydrolase
MEGRMKRIAVLAMVVVMSGVATAADRPEGHSFATRSVVHARHGMVAAAHPLAVEIGLSVLKEGGSAVDAAIAVNAALAFMEPTSCGLGGDIFAMVWDPSSETLHGLNGSGRAPAELTADKVPAEPDGTIPVYSPYSWTVPGAVDGWFELHDKFGKLPMSRLLTPTIAAAREGAPVPRVIAGGWARGAAKFKDMPGFAEVFMPGGKPPAEGELFANPALADTLERMADGGRDAFYGGETAKALVAFSEKVGGFFSLEDLAGHTSEWVEPVSTTYRGTTLWELPPNGQGIAALQILNLIEGFDVAAMGRDSADFWHLIIEAKKIAYEDRARFYADTAFHDLPIAELISKEYAAERAKLIDMTRAAKSIAPGNPGLGRGDTTFLVAADSTGQMVSLIQSNYTGFGSGYVVPELGFGIQDRGALFTLEEGHPNFLEPGKRPFHTIIPAFFGAGSAPDMAFGVMGGDMQPQGHVQIVVNLVDFGMDLQEAGDAARFHHTDSSEPTGTFMTDGGEVHLESGVSAEIKRELMRRGHRISEITPVVFGGYQAIRLNPETGVYAGATESRKDGMAAGY